MSSSNDGVHIVIWASEARDKFMFVRIILANYDAKGSSVKKAEKAEGTTELRRKQMKWDEDTYPHCHCDQTPRGSQCRGLQQKDERRMKTPERRK